MKTLSALLALLLLIGGYAAILMSDAIPLEGIGWVLTALGGMTLAASIFNSRRA